MGLDKLFGGSGNKQPQPAAAATNTTENADKEKRLERVGRLNPLIMTSAAGDTSAVNVGRKLLLGQ